jgi:hypothetical protein
MRALPLVLLLALAACGRGSDDGAGGLSASESRQLDKAAAAIDVNASNGAAEQ